MGYRILVVDSALRLRTHLRNGLSDLGYQVRTASSLAEGLSLARSFRPAVVLMDSCLGVLERPEAVDGFHALDEDMQLILMAACGTIPQAVEAIKRGFCDYLPKPVHLEKLDGVIRREMERLTSCSGPEPDPGMKWPLIGVSPAMESIRQQIQDVADYDSVNLLICGETGTGKEVVVNALHRSSSRRDRPLIKINCGAIPDTLLESEFFGYEKGAFTGAATVKRGLMELAHGGTAFLDELGELPLIMQAKLLSFLEDRTFRRVGGVREIRVNVRIVAATNRNLEEEVSRGTFREDLYYRLNVIQIRIPPLRERPEDIPLLCQYYMEHFSRKFGRHLEGIHPDFLDALVSCPWRGNVRELRNVMERCVLSCRGSILTGDARSLPPAPVRAAPSSPRFPLRDLHQGGIDLRAETEALQRLYICQALELTDGNQTRAAALLGCTRFALRRLLERLSVRL